ncbi:unnamed protein product [Rhizophagus irregularis]|nr:unnamed protein product [Rhizophagus irregularis]
MFLYLLKQRKNDSGYVIIPRLEGPANELTGLFWMMMDRGTLLKELVIAIERELDKESYYTRINDYYGTNPSIGLPSTYNTIFKEIDLVLQAYLSPIPLSIQRTQMNQALLYQGTLISFEYIKEDDGNFEGVLEHSYDIPQIHLKELLNNIPYNNIKEIIYCIKIF